jgi:alpha,alpha-trehalose phosphorylase
VLQHGDATITLTRFASMTEQALAGCVVDVIAGASPIELTIAGEIDAPRLATPPADIDDPRITQAMANPWSEVAVPADPIPCRADRLERSGFTVAVARSAPCRSASRRARRGAYRC